MSQVAIQNLAKISRGDATNLNNRNYPNVFVIVELDRFAQRQSFMTIRHSFGNQLTNTDILPRFNRCINIFES